MIFRAIIKKLLKAIYPFLPLMSLRRTILLFCGYKIGKRVYIPSSFRVSDLKTRRNNLFIGDRVSIGPNVVVITDSSPNNSKLHKIFPLESKDVFIREDAWIGANVVILPGVTIGKCSVIGSGSVVNKNIPEYSIAVGIPAKVIKKINPDEL
jgi:acetyltransferase-like isoleucine patch superfamily enzyme